MEMNASKAPPATKNFSREAKFRGQKKWPFYIEDALCVWTNLGKHSLFVWLFVSSVKTGTRRIIRLDELSPVVRLKREL